MIRIHANAIDNSKAFLLSISWTQNYPQTSVEHSDFHSRSHRVSTVAESWTAVDVHDSSGSRALTAALGAALAGAKGATCKNLAAHLAMTKKSLGCNKKHILI